MIILKSWIDEALKQLIQSGIEPEEAQEDCTWLISELLGISRVQQFVNPQRQISKADSIQLEKALERRVHREPLSHILGYRGFWGLDFKVSSDVLTPRPDTEVVVEEAISWLKRRSESTIPLVVDVCAGSGCIGLSIATELPSQVILIELCDKAFEILTWNQQRLKTNIMGTCELRLGNLLEPLKTSEKADLIVSNPPYITQAELEDLMPEVRNYEPHIALAGGEDGLDLVRPLIVAAWTSLNMEGALMIEVGWKQTESVAQLFREVGFQEVRIRKDYGGNPRVVMGIRRS